MAIKKPGLVSERVSPHRMEASLRKRAACTVDKLAKDDDERLMFLQMLGICDSKGRFIENSEYTQLVPDHTPARIQPSSPPSRGMRG